MVTTYRRAALVAALGLALAATLLFTRGARDEAGEPLRGPHGGRLLRDGDLALEITVFETGVPPEFRVFASDGETSIPPDALRLSLATARLGGRETTFAFVPQGDYLKATAPVVEPHSFDVTVEAAYRGKTSRWRYASYEGRTTIAAEGARAGGIVAETAGPARIRQTLPLAGEIRVNGNRHAAVKARYPGIVREIGPVVGQAVAAGDVVARVETNTGLKLYPVTAPLSGVVVERAANIGEVTADTPLLVIADLATLWAEFHVFPRDLDRVKPGQRLAVQSLDGALRAETVIEALLPVASSSTRTVIARALLANPGGSWRPGMAVRADAIVAETDVPLAVKLSALQRFRDFSVVFAKVGDIYEVRMLDLGLRDETWAEVRGGLDPGTAYVAEGSFLIKADIEKSGASHDH